MFLDDVQHAIEAMSRRIRALEVREVSGTGGGGGVPSGTVVSETAFGQASNAGAAATYSRGDHTHGTPAAPAGTGDMTKVVYDTDDDGSVEAADYAATAGDADTVDGSHAGAFAAAAHVHAGMGDMTKAVYDTDNDNIVESADYAATAGDADKLDGSDAAAFALSGHTHAQLHDAVTISDTATVDLTLVGQALSAAVLPGGIKLDDLGTPDNNTDLNASLTAHGLMPILTGSTTHFLRADGAYAVPPGTPGGAPAMVDVELAVMGLLGWN